MIIGFDCFGTEQGTTFQDTNIINKAYSLELSNGIFDEVFVTEDIISSYNNSREEWNYKVVLDAKFQNNLEGGSVDLGGIPILQVAFQKRKKEDLEWENVATLDYNTLTRVYSIVDKYIQNDCDYEYCIFPLTSGIYGKRVIAEITSDFDGIFLTDKDNNYKLYYNVEHGDIEHVRQSLLLEPLDSKYPIVIEGSLDYRRSSIKATVLCDEIVKSNNPFDNKRLEKENRDKLLTFLKNHKPKIYRSANGDYIMIVILGNPRFIPDNNFNQIIGDISFEFVEIDNIDNDTLKEYGFR